MSGKRQRWRRIGLRREVLILVPASLYLVILLSVFTLLSYRNAVSLLIEEQRAEAIGLARRLAGQISNHSDPAGHLQALAATLPSSFRGTALVAPDGTARARIGSLPDGSLLIPLGADPDPVSHVLGPEDGLDGAIAAFVPIGRQRGERAAGWLRVDLDASTLASQQRSLTLLTWVVLGVDVSLSLLVLLFLGHMLAPYETLLERARSAGATPDGTEDEVAFLLETFERALEGLSRRDGGTEDDIAILQRTLGVSLESGVLLLDRTGAVLALNETGVELLGVDRPAPGTPVEALFAERPGLATPATLISEALARGREVRREECRIEVPGDRTGGAEETGAEGERTIERTLGLTVHVLRRDDDSHGAAPRGFLVLFVDLTEVRRQREQAQLAESLRQLGELSAGIAHELRNSLATIKGYLTLIGRETRSAEDGARTLPPGIEDSLHEIGREAEHLHRVLEDFLSFARPGSVRLEPIDLRLVVERAAADPTLRAGDGDDEAGDGPVIEIDTPDDGERTTISGDRQLLERALRNLLHNAAAAGRETGDRRVHVTVEPLPTGVAVTIADRGPGIPPALRERLYQPFATGRSDGVGLGLALTHRILTLHGATLSLDPRGSGGTLARAMFPRTLDERSRD